MNCTWIPTTTGDEFLVENYAYTTADQMPKNEPNVLGGIDIIDDELDTFYCGWVMCDGNRISLVTRFEPEKARVDVAKRLAVMGHEIVILTAAAA